MSPATFLANNDINITASCIDVDITKDDLLAIDASDCFKAFVFQPAVDRKIQTVNTVNTEAYSATTAVCLAYKAFQHESFEFSMGGLDVTKGLIAKSQKKKIGEMKDWDKSPFLEYQCNKRGSAYAIVKKHERKRFKNCTKSFANKDCSHKRCKKCCLALTTAENFGGTKCRVKFHCPSPQTKSEPAAEAES